MPDSQWLDDLKHCGIQGNKLIFGWFLGASIWPHCPPCTGSWFGCLHWDGDDFEAIIPLTRSGWSIHLSASRHEFMTSQEIK